MASDETVVAVVALVISLIALVITTSQLLAQIFATAEGTRKCSRAVIGHWATLTSWKWHWSEWRFETIFVSPEICLGIPYQATQNESLEQLMEGESSLQTRVLKVDDKLLQDFLQSSRYHSGQFLDGWLAMLITLRIVASNAPDQKTMYAPSWPGIRLHRRSWDTMPPDVLRPIASTNLSNIAIIARRMGMIWNVFQPEEGRLFAAGDGHSLRSIDIRGLGLALRYDRQGPHSSFHDISFLKSTNIEKSNVVVAKTALWIPLADKLQFGIFPGNMDLKLQDFNVSSDEEVLEVFNNHLDLKDIANWKQVFGSKFTNAWYRRYEINELLALASPLFRPMHSADHTIILPQYDASIFVFETAWNVHRALIQRRLETAKRTAYLEELSHTITSLPQTSRLGSLFRDKMSAEEKVEALDSIHRVYDQTTRYFQSIQLKMLFGHHREFYFDLLRAHFAISPLISIESRAKCRGKNAQKARDADLKGDKHSWRSEQVNMLWDNFPNITSFLIKEGYKRLEPIVIEEAWITLFLRGLCWCSLNPHNKANKGGDFIPSKYYGSQIPVFLS